MSPMAIDMLLSGVAEPGLEGHVSWSTLGVHLWKGSSPHSTRPFQVDNIFMAKPTLMLQVQI